MNKYYNIHNILAFRIIDKPSIGNKLFNDWDIELRGFESSNLNNADFVISMGRFKPDNHNCTILDNDYYIKENYLYCHRDSCQHAKWQLEISGLEQGETIVRINPNLLGKMLIPELIINPLIWFKLTGKGYPVVHGSAVSRDSQAYIFAGRGASGKTTIALNLVEKGFKLISEHFVILGKDNVLSFPTPLHIMDFNLVPILRNNMSSNHKNSFRLNRLIHRVTGKRIATKVLPEDILPEPLVNKGKLHSIFLLLPGAEFRATRIGKEELINHLLANQKLETIPFVKYMMEYAYLFPRSEMATYWTRYVETLSQALDTARAFYRLEVPLNYDGETLKKLNQLVED